MSMSFDLLLFVIDLLPISLSVHEADFIGLEDIQDLANYSKSWHEIKMGPIYFLVHVTGFIVNDSSFHIH